MGYCQTRLSDSAASISTFNRLIEKYKSHQYQNLLAYSFQSIADAYTTENKWSSAIENTNLSLSVLEKSDDWAGYFRSQATAASIRRILGMYKESLTANLLGISTAEQYPVEPRQVWNLYSSLSLNLLKLGHTQSAMDVQQEAHFLAKKVDWPLYQSLSHARQGMIQLELGNSEVAVELANQALIEASRIIDESTKTDTLADALFFKAHLLRRSGNYSEAVKNYELAIGLYEKTPYHLFSYKAYQGRFLARLALKDETNGEEDLEQAVALLEKFRGKILDENFRDSFFDESQEFYDTAINFEYVHRNNAIRAFQLSEDSRARSFLDSRQSSPHILKTDRSVDLQIQSLANPLSLGEIQQRLPEQTQIIQYSVLSEKIIIWIINSKSIFSAHQDISEKVLSEKIANFTTLVTASDESAIKQRVALSKELYNILIQPIESHLRQQELLCIVPDKQLNCLPFGALISASPGKYFIEDYTFVISPGATAFILCSETAKEKFTIAEERLLCLGNPKITNGEFSSLPNLRNAETEARQIAALYNSPHLLIGTEAKESLFAKLAPKIDVLHIAGHSIVDEASPLLSKLLLAADYPQNSNTESTDGILHLYELYQLRISKPKLVILSSCRTGRGRIYQSEGMVTLARPFLVAGVPTVISSLWDVDSEKTKELMIRFHTIRKRYRFSASKALRQAQLEMVCAGNNCPQSSLAWAAFNVVGGDYNVRF